MSPVGPYLRDLRERRGVSIEEIARTTRVGRPYLEALEAGDLSKLPAPVFTRGFVLAYCEALGEPPDEALALYKGRPSAPVAVTPPPLPERERVSTGRRGPVLVSFVLLVVFGAALFGVASLLQSGREPTPPREATAVERPSAPVAQDPAPSAPAPSVSPTESIAPGAEASAPTPTARATAAPGTTPAPPAIVATPAPTPRDIAVAVGSVSPPYRLVARTTAATWVRVRTADGRQSDETIPAGQVREWVSDRPFAVSIGNAGGVRLELNGQALPALGPNGAVVSRLLLPPETP